MSLTWDSFRAEKQLCKCVFKHIEKQKNYLLLQGAKSVSWANDKPGRKGLGAKCFREKEL